MSRGPCRFKKTDVRRAIEAAKACGLDIARVVIRDGEIIVIAGNGAIDQDAASTLNEWDAA
jgi:hypothetical protein